MADELVLVTGASGFIATHVIQQLQQGGYRVRGTVRNISDHATVSMIKNLCPDAKYPVELIQADLLDKDVWGAAVTDCDYVIHIAGPPPVQEDGLGEEAILATAVDGTLTVLRAAQKSERVKRVVVTSSIQAIINSAHKDQKKEYSESNWTDSDQAHFYAKCKTLAERAAWKFVTDEKSKFQLVTLNPVLVTGPVLNNRLSGTRLTAYNLLQNKIPMAPPLDFMFVDVRDVAKAHVISLTNDDVANKRIILSSANAKIGDIAKSLHGEFKNQGYKVPTKTAPKLALWTFSKFNDKLNSQVVLAGNFNLNTEIMRDVLQMAPIKPEKSFIDMAYSMIDADLIPKTAQYKGSAK